MRFRSKATGAVLEPRCEAVEAVMRASPDYEVIRETENRGSGKRGTRAKEAGESGR